MFITTHLRIAYRAVRYSAARVRFLPYLFGAIAPDVLGWRDRHHELSDMMDIFPRYLEKAQKDESFLRQSFWLGVVTHFICDYFCAPHNFDELKCFKEHASYELRLELTNAVTRIVDADFDLDSILENYVECNPSQPLWEALLAIHTIYIHKHSELCQSGAKHIRYDLYYAMAVSTYTIGTVASHISVIEYMLHAMNSHRAYAHRK